MEPAQSISYDPYDGVYFPWAFYFNGRALPRWAGNWSLANILSHLSLEYGSDHGEIHNVYCRIDHVGVVESEDPAVFLYTIQEVLLILIRDRAAVQECLRESTECPDREIYEGLLEGAFMMRELVLAERRAFWTSGYEKDRSRLVHVMDACAPDPLVPDAQLAPHVQRRRGHFEHLTSCQREKLRRLSHDKAVEPKMRARLQRLFSKR